MNRSADVVDKSGQRNFGAAASTANRLSRLEHNHGVARLRQRNRGG
jgi:hypothetical protein